MNQHLRPSHFAPTTRAAEGLDRRRWTVAEIEAMVAGGIIDEHERIELIGGEVVPMAAKGIHHETLKVALAKHWYRRLPQGVEFAQETTFHLSEDTFVEPDFVFWPTRHRLADLRPETALLAIEIADSSLAFDLGRKALLYASFAIPEVWVIDARKRITHVLREPADGDYRVKRKLGARKLLDFSFAPELNVRLADLEGV